MAAGIGADEDGAHAHSTTVEGRIDDLEAATRRDRFWRRFGVVVRTVRRIFDWCRRRAAAASGVLAVIIGVGGLAVGLNAHQDAAASKRTAVVALHAADAAATVATNAAASASTATRAAQDADAQAAEVSQQIVDAAARLDANVAALDELRASSLAANEQVAAALASIGDGLRDASARLDDNAESIDQVRAEYAAGDLALLEALGRISDAARSAADIEAQARDTADRALYRAIGDMAVDVSATSSRLDVLVDRVAVLVETVAALCDPANVHLYTPCP